MSYKLLLYTCMIYLCSGNEVLQTAINEILLTKNVKYVAYLMDEYGLIHIARSTREQCMRLSYQKLHNAIKITNSTILLSNLAYVVLINNNVPQEILQLSHRRKFTILIVAENLNETLTDMSKSNLRWDSDVFVISFKKKSVENVTYEIWKMYGFQKVEVPPVVKYIGMWPSLSQENISSNWYSERRSLQNICLNISSSFYKDECVPNTRPPWESSSNSVQLRNKLRQHRRFLTSSVSKPREAGSVNNEFIYLRTEHEINDIFINLLKYIHNFSIEVIQSKDLSNKLDITTGFMEENTVDIADYITQVYPFRKTFILKNPVGGNRNIFIKPFSSQVWYMFILLVILMIITLKLLLSILKRFDMVDDKSWSLVMLILLSTFCLEGCPVDYNFISFRLYVITSLLTSVLLYNYYSSSIVSLLLSNPTANVKCVKDLQRVKIKLGIEDIPDYYQVDNSTFKFSDLDKITYNLSEAISQIKNGDFAYYTEPATRYKLLEKQLTFLEICSLIEIDAVPTAYTAFMVPKNSEFKEMFTIRRIIERGFLKRELNRLLRKKPACLAHVDFVGLTLNDLYAAFVLFYCGVVLSLIILILEHLHVRMSCVYYKKMQ